MNGLDFKVIAKDRDEDGNWHIQIEGDNPGYVYVIAPHRQGLLEKGEHPGMLAHHTYYLKLERTDMEIIKVEISELGGFARLFYGDGTAIITSIKEARRIRRESAAYIPLEEL